MRVFLSHSSTDKSYVEAVRRSLRPGTYELDSETFDKGVLNSIAIQKALKRCDLFCLFLSKLSTASSYVKYESLLAEELIASGQVNRILVLCLDDHAFSLAQPHLKKYNILRKKLTPDAAGRLIQGALLTSSSISKRLSEAFVGREKELAALEREVNDLERAEVTAIYVSGNYGIGRRSLLRKFFQNHFPHVNPAMPTVEIADFDGALELFRHVVSALRPSMSLTELRQMLATLDPQKPEAWVQATIAEINAALNDNEALIVYDAGGLLASTGQLKDEFCQIASSVHSRPHPALVFVSPRMVPYNFRKYLPSVVFLPIPSFRREDSQRLLVKLLRDAGQKPRNEQIEHILELCDDHPFNIRSAVEQIAQNGADLFLADPSNFIEWKVRASADYVSKLSFTEVERRAVAVLLLIPQIDFSALSSAVPDDESALASALTRLIDWHIVATEDERFSLSSGLRVAIERDPRFQLKDAERLTATKAIASDLTLRFEGETASISLLDAAILSQLETGGVHSLFSAFLLPSHQVRMAKRHYDQRRWKESQRLAREALKGKDRLSAAGRAAALRYVCLSSSRNGDQSAFDLGIAELKALPSDDYRDSNIHFLLGFNHRLNGRIVEAHDAFHRSYTHEKRNYSTLRELATTSMFLDQLEDAEAFAREAFSLVPANPFVIDVLVSVLIKKAGKDYAANAELVDLLERLKEVDEDSGRSFYATRRAELELLWGDPDLAMHYIEGAFKRTPYLAEVIKIYFSAAIKRRDYARAREMLIKMRELVFDPKNAEQKSHLRAFVLMELDLMIETGKLDDAREKVRTSIVLTEYDKKKYFREISFLMAGQ